MNRLGYYPLALCQAGRYIHETQINFLQYVERYEFEVQSLLKQELSAREYPNRSINAALGLSYETLKARDPTAAALLAFCGCLDNANISWKFFSFNFHPHCECSLCRRNPECPWILGLPERWFENLQNDQEQYDNAVQSLLTFSLVQRDTESRGISIHPIVQQWTLTLYGKEVERAFLEKTCELISHKSLHREPIDQFLDTFLEPQDFEFLTRARPHADRCMSLIGINLMGWKASTLISLGCYYTTQYESEKANELTKVGVSLIDEGANEASTSMTLANVKFRLMVAEVYVECDAPANEQIDNIRAAQSYLADPGLITTERDIFYGLCADLWSSVVFVTQSEFAQARKAANEVIKRGNVLGLSHPALFIARSLVVTILKMMDEKSDVIMEARSLIEDIEKLRPFGNPYHSEVFENVLVNVKMDAGFVCGELGCHEEGEAYALSALLATERINGSRALGTLKCARLYHFFQMLKTRNQKSSPVAFHQGDINPQGVGRRHRLMLSTITGKSTVAPRERKRHRPWSKAINAFHTVMRHKHQVVLPIASFQQPESSVEPFAPSSGRLTSSKERWREAIGAVLIVVQHRPGTLLYQRLIHEERLKTV